jgi:hypothetical protein
MDISNETGQDTRFKVTGTGGSGMGPHGGTSIRPEDTVNWKVLAANSTVRHKPASKGPWKVYFFIDGHGVVAAEASSDTDHVQLLVAHTDTFQAKVRKVSHAKADRTVNAV